MSVSFIGTTIPTHIERDEDFPCFCVRLNLEDCTECGGDRHYRFEVFPGELNVSNANARILLRFLELDGADEPQPQGSCSPFALVIAINKARAALAKSPQWIRKTTDERIRRTTRGVMPMISPGPRIIDCGLSRDRIDRYLQQLETLAELARKYASQIQWA